MVEKLTYLPENRTFIDRMPEIKVQGEQAVKKREKNRVRNKAARKARKNCR